MSEEFGERSFDKKVGCFQCGWCCRYYKIFVTPDEAEFIAREERLPLDKVAEFNYDLAWFGEENLFLLKEPGGCTFLKNVPGTKRVICGIHNIKPQVCRKYAAGLEKMACQQGLATVWGLIVGSSGQIEGEDDKLRDFYDFIESIKE